MKFAFWSNPPVHDPCSQTHLPSRRSDHRRRPQGGSPIGHEAKCKFQDLTPFLLSCPFLPWDEWRALETSSPSCATIYTDMAFYNNKAKGVGACVDIYRRIVTSPAPLPRPMPT